MSQSSEKTLYDVLGVARDATTAQIQKAWRRKTDKAGPGTPAFAEVNEAAETLLDPPKRAAYDATIAPVVVAEDVEDESVSNGASASSTVGKKLIALALLPILALGAVALAIIFTVQHHQQGLTDTARAEAPATAERALKAVLAYDYRQLPQDRAAAEKFMTTKYAKEYGRTFDLLAKGQDGQAGAAVQTKTVVTADVVGTAVMDAEAHRVNVLAYVNQSSRHGANDPIVFQNRVQVAMVEHGGQWLIDDLKPR